MLVDGLIFVAGLFAWTLVEYVIHGVLAHAHRTFVTGLHDVHHRDPRAVFALGAWIPTALVLAASLGWFGFAPGVIFYGALSGGFAHAFTLSLAELATLLLGVAALTRLLPQRGAT